MYIQYLSGFKVHQANFQFIVAIAKHQSVVSITGFYELKENNFP